MIVFRLASYDTPFPPTPSRRAGRYSTKGGDVANYWCLHPHGPWAERMRWEGLTAPTAADQLLGRIWAARIEQIEPVTVGFDHAPAHGLRAEDLVVDDYGPCQAAADRWRAAGIGAVIVPSAALPGTENLVVFGQRLAVAWLGPITDIDLDIPAAVAGDRATPPSGVARHVRHYGAVHKGLDAHRQGRTYRYPQAVEVP